MQITFLGTAAAEGYPGLWCLCQHCEAARNSRGKSARCRSALLINDDLLVDFGPDVLQAAARLGLRLASVTSVLVTHFHGDHFHMTNINLRAPGFRAQALPLLTVYGPAEVAAEVEKIADLGKVMAAPRAVRPFEQFDAGRYSVTAFPAAHGTKQPLIYAVAQGRARILVAFDTGPLLDETWQALSGYVFNAVIMEETMGSERCEGHMGIAEMLAAKRRLEKEAMLAPDCRFVITHMSHHCNPPHEELEAMLRPHGIEVAFDGLRIEV